jgi:hypothetical protein
MAPAQKYVDITITYDPRTGKITVSPDPAQLYWVTGPDSARWRVGTTPSTAASFDIQFGTGSSPFTSSGLNLGPSAPALIGTGNTQVKGTFKYSVVFRDASGNVVASEDPRLDNTDQPDP